MDYLVYKLKMEIQYHKQFWKQSKKYVSHLTKKTLDIDDAILCAVYTKKTIIKKKSLPEVGGIIYPACP